MARIRVKGEGSIYQRANGRFRAQIWIAGERLSYSAKTKKEARDWLLKIRNKVNNGLNVEGSKIIYSDFLDDWLETKKPQVAEQTWSYYAQIVRDYIKPKLGMYKLRELSTRRIQGFYNHLVEQGVGLRTIEKNHTIIHASLNYAVKYGLIPSNPDAFTDPPKPEKREIELGNGLLGEQMLIDKQSQADYNHVAFGLFHEYLSVKTVQPERYIHGKI